MKILRHHLQRSFAALAIIETAAFMAIPYGVLRLFALQGDGQGAPLTHPGWPLIALFALITQTGALAVGLYSPWLRAGPLGLLMRAIVSATGGALVMLPITLLAGYALSWCKVLFAAALLSACATFLLRLLFLRIVDEDAFKSRVLVYGAGRAAASLAQLRRRSDRRGFLIAGFVQPPGENLAVPPSQLIAGSQLPALADAHQIDEIVVAMDERRSVFPLEELLECRLRGIEVVDLTTFLERETGKVHLESLNPSWLIFGPGFRRDAIRLATERAFDVIASLGLLLLAWPFMLITMLAIKLEEGWRAPVLYRQKRVGLGNRVFEVLKFRSMSVNAECGGVRWATKNDSRITRVGAVIRKIRIDELPQVLNILRGDMSFVGPRPERPEFVDMLAQKIPFYRERHFVKPGLTGWAQICYPYGSSEQDAAQKLQYDLYYVKNHRLLFDLYVLLQTAEVILWRKGAR
jgi:sugar transferase (PEP-CTERM system associated)